MKKLYYLFTLLGAAMAFTSCNPLDKTYKVLDVNPTPKTLNYTLVAADFASLPSTVTASKTHTFASAADANANIPAILNYKFFDYSNGSTGFITYSNQPVLADSVFKDEAYTLTNPDYLLLPGNKFADFSVAQVLTWLPYKFTAPAANQMYVLTWIFYPTLSATAPQIYPGLSLSTTGNVTTATGSFLFLNGSWIQAYQVTPAQYAAIGRGQYNQFTSADDAMLVTYFNGILKTDASVMANAVAGSTQYVSFNYYNAAKVTAQRVIGLTYNGTNWVMGGANTLIFIKANGTWIADPSVYYTLIKADTQLIGNPTGTNNQTIGTSAQRANLYQYGDFSGWVTADLDNAMILVLKTNFPNPKVNISYKVTFPLYSGGKDVPTTYVFTYNGTNWVAAQ